MPSEKKTYATKQKQQLIDFFRAHPNGQYTAKQLIESEELLLGEATVYRLLGKLTQDGLLHRLTPDRGRTTSYQYNPVATCRNHLHLKCQHCGTVHCMDCDWMTDFSAHLKQAHGFTITQEDTTITGMCEACEQRV